MKLGERSLGARIFLVMVAACLLHFSFARINIGVTDEWSGLVRSMLANATSAKLKIEYDVTPLRAHKSLVMYDQILQDVKTIQDSSIHVLIGDYNEALATASEKLNVTYICTNARTRAFADLASTFRWLKIGVFYDDSFGISMIEHLMSNHDVTVRMWKITDSADTLEIRDFLIQMRKVWIQKVIVFCDNDRTRFVLEQARGLAMVSIPYEWSFFDPDGKCLDVFNDFSDVSNNFTVISILPFENAACSEDTRNELGHLSQSLVRDAFDVVASATHRAHGAISRSDGDLATVRALLSLSISDTKLKGRTGEIIFNSDGLRTNISLSITEMVGMKANQIGIWRSDGNTFRTRLHIWPSSFNRSRITPFPLRGRTVSVVTILEPPFTMLKKNHEKFSGNDRFEGYAIDLIYDIAQRLDFNYKLYLVQDGKFGAKDKTTGEWNGMIGELLAGNATMSVAPLSINSDREEAIDFTKPFMTRYISVVMKKPESETSYFEFLNPLSPKVWICTFVAFIGVSVVLYILERVANKDQVIKAEISFKECFWFIFGSLLQGNTDGSPNSISGRIITSSWWFFALILISSYTANLAAFLTVKKINTPIKSVVDLPQQTRYKYGTVTHSGVMSFFEQSKIEHFAKMWAEMWEVDRTSMVDNTTEGYKRVLEGDYAFFWDTTVNKYKTIEHCSFMEIGPYFDAKGFGIGVPPGATYREDLSLGILKLSDIGRLYELENKWWSTRNCPGDTKVSSAETSELHIDNVAGVFFILLGGIVLSLIVLASEKCFVHIRAKYFNVRTN